STTTSTSTTTSSTSTTSTSTTTVKPTTTTSTSTSSTSSTSTTTTTEAPTTTTVPPTTTTVPEQKSVPVTGSNTNKCVQTIYIGDPADGNTLGDPTFADVGVTFTAKAFPQPHLGDPIQLTGANLHITVAAAVLQAGVDQ